MTNDKLACPTCKLTLDKKQPDSIYDLRQRWKCPFCSTDVELQLYETESQVRTVYTITMTEEKM